MTDSDPTVSRPIGRRTLIGLLAGAVATPALAAEHPSMAYMRRVAKDLLNAHRQGTVASFRRVIQRHADVAEIANYSLGQYRNKLPDSQRSRYYGGVATFMARYFADQSREFRIAKYVLGDAAAAAKDILIDSKVFLLSGQTYTVVWRLAWRGGAYKVADVKVLGFSMVFMQRGLFTSYIAKRDGDVAQLVAALNR
jgi:phospholipid transport system substrate-binding protein